METRVSSKGQITLPKSVRRKLSITPGDVLLVKAVGTRNIILERKQPETPVNALEIVRSTAGLWKDLPQDGIEYVKAIRNTDAHRLEALGLEPHPR